MKHEIPVRLYEFVAAVLTGSPNKSTYKILTHIVDTWEVGGLRLAVQSMRQCGTEAGNAYAEALEKWMEVSK